MKYKNLVFVLIIVGIVVLAVIFMGVKEEEADCRIISLEVESKYQIPETREIPMTISISNFGATECVIYNIRGSGELIASINPFDGLFPELKLSEENKIIGPKETKKYTLIGYIAPLETSPYKVGVVVDFNQNKNKRLEEIKNIIILE